MLQPSTCCHRRIMTSQRYCMISSSIERLISGYRASGSTARCCSTHANVSSQLPQHFLTLERAVGERAGVDDALWESGIFAAQVYPDLPFATTWSGLLRAAPRLLTANVQQTVDGPLPSTATNSGLLVKTVAAQLRNKQDLQQRICQNCCVGLDGEALDVSGRHRASALFMVSGSHPLRTAPFLPRLLNNSVGLLKMANDLRQRGVIPASTGLWASANPNTETTPDWLQAKVDAGAEVILTQPPLDWAAFERWMETVDNLSLSQRARLVVGVPMISSAPNLAFWIALAGSGGNAAARQLLLDFQRQAQRPSAEFDAFCLHWNRQLIRKVLSIPGVAGLHVMPITPKARKLTLQLAQEGVLRGGSKETSATVQ